MLWPSWLWIGTRGKFFMWLGNRVTTWIGSFYVWKRLRVNRNRKVWLWLALINVVSLSALGVLFYWLHVRSSHH